MIDRYPYGKAPFALLMIAIVSVGLRFATARRHDERPDLVVVTFIDARYESYRRAIPRFEREHGVKVQLQQMHWASLQARLQNAMLAGTEVPDLAELFEGSMGMLGSIRGLISPHSCAAVCQVVCQTGPGN